MLFALTGAGGNVNIANTGSVTFSNDASVGGTFTLTTTQDSSGAGSGAISDGLFSISAGTLSFSAAGPITVSNALTGTNSLSLKSDTVTINSGGVVQGGSVSIIGQTVNGSSTTPMTVTNSGSIISNDSKGSLTIASAPGQELDIDGNGSGVVQAQAGTQISFIANFNNTHQPNLVFNASQTISFNGTSTTANAVTFTADGSPTAAVVVDNGVTVNVTTSNTRININTCNLTLIGNGHINANGNMEFINCPFENGTIANSGGSIDLAQFPNLTFNGQNLAILASGNIINSGGPVAIDLSDTSGPGHAGGSLTLLAGFTLTPDTGGATIGPNQNQTFTITGLSAGGSISLSNVNINTSGAGSAGNVFAAANGSVSLGSITAQGGTDHGGNVTLIGTGVTVGGTIDTTGTGSGTVSVNSASPVINGSPAFLNGKLVAASGSISSGTTPNGAVSLAGVTSPGAAVTITAGAGIQSSAIVDAAKLTMSTTTGDIGGSSSPLVTTAGTLTAGTGNGAVSIQDTSNAVTLTGFNAGTTYSLIVAPTSGSGTINIGTINLGDSVSGFASLVLQANGPNSLINIAGTGSEVGAKGVSLTAASIVNKGTLEPAANLMLNGAGISASTAFSYSGTGSIVFGGGVTQGLTIASTGSIDLTPILNQVTGGLSGTNLLVVAGGSITSGAGGTSTTFNTSSGPLGGGSVTMAAGATYTTPSANQVTITGFSGTTGNINLNIAGGTPINSITTGSGTGAAGDVTLVATGLINLPGTGSIDTSGTTQNGSVNVIAGANSGTAVTLGAITTAGVVTSSATHGSVSSTVGAPAVTASVTFSNGGRTGGGTFVASGPPTNGDVSVGAINANGGNITISTGGSISATTLKAGSGTLSATAGGNITITAGTTSSSLSLLATGPTSVLNLPTGTTTIGPSSGQMTVQRDGSGDGVVIDLEAHVVQVGGTASNGLTLDASGSGTGNGGTAEVTLTGTAAATIGTGSWVLKASSGATGGSAGEVSFITGGNLTVAPGSLGITAAKGNGGTIVLTSGGNLLVSGSLSANAGGSLVSFNGGEIDLTSKSTTVFNIGLNTAANKNGVKGALTVSGVGAGTNGTIKVFNSAGGITDGTSLAKVASVTLDTTGASAGTITISKPIGNLQTNSITIHAGGSGKIVAPGQTLVAAHNAASFISLSSGTGAISGITVTTPNLTANTTGSTGAVSITDKDLAGVTLGASSAGSTFSLTNSGSITTSGLVSAPTSVTFKDTALNESITLGASVTTSATGTVTLTATGTGNITDTAGTITGHTIALTTGSGTIGTGGTPLSVTSTGTGGSKLTVKTTGLVNINNVSGAVTFAGSNTTHALTLTSGGNVTVSAPIATASSVSISTSNNTSIALNSTIGSPTATTTINVSANGSGSISGTATLADKTSTSLASGTGNIRGSSTAALKVNTPAVSANTGGSGVVNVADSRILATTLSNSTSGGSFAFTSGGPLTVNSISTAQGAITVIASTGALNVAPGASIVANSSSATVLPNITLEAKSATNGSIAIGNNATIESLSTVVGAGGTVNIVIGPVPTTLNNPFATTPLPANTNVVNADNIFAGANPTAIIGPGAGAAATLASIGGAVLEFNSPSVTRTITLGNGAAVTADPPTGAIINSGLPPAGTGAGTLVMNSGLTPAVTVAAGVVPNSGRTPAGTGAEMFVTNSGLTPAVTGAGTFVTNSGLSTAANNAATIAYGATTAYGARAIPAQSVILSDAASNAEVNADLWSDKELGIKPHANRASDYESAVNNGSAVVNLRSGNVVMAPSIPTTVKTSLGDVSIAANSLVLIMSYQGAVCIYNLDDNHTDSVVVNVGGHTLTLSPGRQAVVTTNNAQEFELVNPAESFAYRNMKSTELGGGIKVFTSEFWVPAAVHNVGSLKHLVKSTQPQAAKIYGHLMKTAAILTQTRGTAGFKLIPHPRVFAMLP
jgi:hypothetical protein